MLYRELPLMDILVLQELVKYVPVVIQAHATLSLSNWSTYLRDMWILPLLNFVHSSPSKTRTSPKTDAYSWSPL